MFFFQVDKRTICTTSVFRDRWIAYRFRPEKLNKVTVFDIDIGPFLNA